MDWFYFYFYSFCITLFISTILVIVLFVIFQSKNLNILLRTCCIVVFFLNSLIFSSLYLGPNLFEHDNFCFGQAVLLNYCYICIHAHISCLMVNNCLLALRMRLMRSGSNFLRIWTFLIISFTVPLVPTMYIALARSIETINKANDIAVYPRSFYCVLDDPSGVVSSLWFIIFSLPGIFCAFYLLYRVIKSRQTLKIKAGSQFKKFDLVKLFLIVVLYASCSVLSWPPTSVNPPVNYTMDELPKTTIPSPWQHPQFCSEPSDNIFVQYEKRIRCPSASTFLPGFIGIVLFIMYGFSSTAITFYKDLFIFTKGRLKTKRGRRSSTMPLIDHRHLTIQSTTKPEVSRLTRRSSEPADPNTTLFNNSDLSSINEGSINTWFLDQNFIQRVEGG